MPKILLIDTDDFLGAADFLSRQMVRDDVAVNSDSIGPRKLTGEDVLTAACEHSHCEVPWNTVSPEVRAAYSEQAKILNRLAGL